MEKSEILGLLCAEGTYRKYNTFYFGFDKRRNRSYPTFQTKQMIEFANTNILLLKYFQRLLKIEYNYFPNIIKSNHNVFRVSITKNDIINDLVNLTYFGSKRWAVPKDVFEADENVQKAFIRGFFDGDGCVDLNEGKLPRIRLCSINKNGLFSIGRLFSKFNIDYKINGPYKNSKGSNGFELLLRTKSVENFIKYIGSNHNKKREIFNKITKLKSRK